MIIARLYILMAFALSFVGCSTSVKYARHAAWKDEFHGNGSPNSKMWARSVTEPGDQLSAYCDEESNVYVKDGMLHLRVIKTNDPDMPYSAGRVIIGKNFHFKRGKLVVRAKAPITAGLWPAIWLNGPKTSEGYFAELDLMEHVYAMGDSCYEAVYHLWGDFREKENNHVSYGQHVAVNVGDWHIYQLEVLDDMIKMSVDGKEVYVIRKGAYGEEWPEGQEYSLRLALAYGGYGAQKTGIDDSALPAEMLIDYVRFYELKDKN